MGKYAEGRAANVLWCGRFWAATGLRWVADKVHEDTRYRVTGYTMQLQPGGGVKFEEHGDGLPLLYVDKDYELFHVPENRWVPYEEVREVTKKIDAHLLGRKWTRAQVDEILAVLNVRG